MWNGHFDALQGPNRAVPDRGSVLKNNRFAVLYNILSVVGVFGTPYISSVFCPRTGPSLKTQATRLEFCPKAGLPFQTQEPKLQFY